MENHESGRQQPANIDRSGEDRKHNDAVGRMVHWVWQLLWAFWPVSLLGTIMLIIIIYFALR